MTNYWVGSYKPIGKSDPIRCIRNEDVKHFDDLDLINYSCPGWYFWNETWSTLHGPFNTLEDCENALINYTRSI